ncbi:hypothetical protein QE382_002323 [Sphingobacterium zeae]|uniref:Phage abortive infection protein n=1 Tax=Sphingobacterium zeae TaxID=1776859 RepID=A0ABU0U650_9SPHI|nr:hypothetical protein [Sphingobacterium zeae]MDQ1150339.1 hypothetical protein [Sphingobacterium zeae]
MAVVGLLIALKTYEVATKALGEWKNQKIFEIDIDGYANTLEALKVLEDLRFEQYNPDLVQSHSKEILTDIFNAGEKDVYKSYINLYSYIGYYSDLKPKIFEVRKKAIIIFNQSEDKDLIDFYDHFMSFEANIFSIHHNYHTSIINRFIDKYEYNTIVKESPAVNLYFNAIKLENPNIEDFEIYKLLYEKFFLLHDGDWLESLRAKHTSFFYRNFKRNVN